MPLQDLPVELIQVIADCANYADLNALCRTNRQLHIIVEPVLYQKDVQTPTSRAVSWGSKKGQWAPIEKWTLQGGDLLQLEKHETPLFLAVMYSQMVMVKRFLEIGLNPNSEYPDGRRILHRAVLFGNVDIAKLLIDAGGSVHDEDDEDPDRNLLCLAAQGKETDMVRFILGRTSRIESPAERCMGALATAAAAGSLDTVKVLLDYGADLNPEPVRRHIGYGVPFFAAVLGDNIEVVRLLLEKGASPHVRWELRREFHRRTFDVPVLCAVHNENVEMLSLLLDWGVGVDSMDISRKTGLSLAASTGDVASARLLLDRGAKHDIRDEHGNQALNNATEQGHTQIVELLLAAGANPGPKSVIIGQQYPLEVAAREGHTEIVRMLLEKGADPDFVNYHGWTPLCRAVEKGDGEIVRRLLDHSADPNKIGGFDIPPLTHAARLGSMDIVSALIENGADIEMADLHEFRPLHGAVRGGHPDVVCLLLGHGADIEAVGRGNVTPLFISASEGDEAVVRLLIERGANLDCRGEGGLTPLAIANAEGYDNVAKLLRDHGAHTTRELDGD